MSTNVADTTPATQPYSMGLAGWVGQLANMTAIAVICLLFVLDHQADRQQAKEDRAMFREAVREQRSATDRLAQEFRNLTEEIRTQRRMPLP